MKTLLIIKRIISSQLEFYNIIKLVNKVFENKKGTIQIFPCELMHMVPETKEERITIGITLHSYPSITKGLINQLAFNSRDYKGSIILTKEYYG